MLHICWSKMSVYSKATTVSLRTTTTAHRSFGFTNSGFAKDCQIPNCVYNASCKSQTSLFHFHLQLPLSYRLMYLYAINHSFTLVCTLHTSMQVWFYNTNWSFVKIVSNLQHLSALNNMSYKVHSTHVCPWHT